MNRSKNEWEGELGLSLKKLATQLETRGKSRLTQAAYVGCVSRCVHHVKRRPSKIMAAQVRSVSCT
jgi:hypothetical protein